MSKFNPKEVPSWCRWMAIDPNGDVWAYSAKPLSDHMIYEWWPKSHKGKEVLLYKDKKPKNWKDELYTWL